MNTENEKGFILMNMQKYFVKQLSPCTKSKLLRSQIQAIRYCRDNDCPLYVVEDLFNSHTIVELEREFDSLKKRKTLDTLCNDAFEEPSFNQILEEEGIKELCFMGLYASNSIYNTARSALEKNYKISTSEQFIGEPGMKELGLKVRNLFEKNGKFYEDHHDLLK